MLKIQEEDHPIHVARKIFSNVVCPTSDEFDDEAISSLRSMEGAISNLRFRKSLAR